MIKAIGFDFGGVFLTDCWSVMEHNWGKGSISLWSCCFFNSSCCFGGFC